MTVEKRSPVGDSAAAFISVLHVGPGRGQRGGIASVLGELAEQRERFAEHGIRLAFFETHGFRRIGSAIRFVGLDLPRFVMCARATDVVHFHVSERGSFYRKWVLSLLATLMRKRVVFHLHSGNFGRFASLSGRLTRASIRRFVGHADAAIGVSESGAAILNRFRVEADDARVIANTAGAAQRDALRPRVREPDASHPYIAFVGRLSQQKGAGILIEALAQLVKRGCNVHLRLAGEGDAERWRACAVELGVADRVHFAGWLDEAGKSQLLRGASVFCLPSQFEAFGIAALEAMFFGVPIVASRVGGLCDLVEDGVSGYLVDPDDASALADSLRDLLCDVERGKRMGAAGRDRACRLYAVEVVTTQYVDCYQGIAGHA
ncbi:MULTISPECIES: glycosyltransferase family 4 protein [unclassified Burkholderia]|uniref:glycosyltransferase family 4 protein n=1 Tax=unclassified Burkholderia TaxID=2613784 RepID=UPI00142053FE|nr:MULTISPECIES: glycosyltransferase family 4 protein [unclassified Burkholderia]NIE56301.1 glycosyltransferase family 4 protein [Burkholderia sp. Ap-955]NIF08306.1 glycosyltransferase family 4 protein [Burkholderia sp. Ax-1735]NIG00960.1 glycosyltransferase family 4 protein [Burkholderia sp. Tr-849]